MLRGMNRLRLGEFRAGWVDYAAREAIPELFRQWSAGAGEPDLAGQALSGRTLVVTDDQGHGDAIQFFRYLPLLRDRGAAHITWRTFPPLVRLMADAAPYATVLDALPGDVRFDFQCNSTSLPRWFGTEVAQHPGTCALPAVAVRPGIRDAASQAAPRSGVGRAKRRDRRWVWRGRVIRGTRATICARFRRTCSCAWPTCRGSASIACSTRCERRIWRR